MQSTSPTAALALLLLAACSHADLPKAPASTALIDTLPGGAMRIRNPESAAPLAWRFVAERVIQPAEGSPGELGEVRGVVATADGRVAVIQSRPDAIHLYGPDGAYLRSIGRDGDGPGEFRRGAIGLHGDTLLVHDASNSRASTFLLDGTFLASWRAPCCMLGMGSVRVDGAGQVWIVTLSRGGGAFVRYRFDGTLVDTVRTTPREPGGIWTISHGSGATAGGAAVPIPLAPHQNWGFPSDGRFAYGRSDQYRIVIGRNGSDTMRVIEASGEGRATTEAERDSLFREAIPPGMTGRDAMQQVARQGDIPARWPVWSGMAFDPAGRLWVSRPGAHSEADTLEVFSPAGERLGWLPSPHPQLLDGFWAGDRIYLRGEDAEGKPLVRVFRLERDTIRP